MKYLPFLDGKYSTAPGLQVMSRAGEKDKLFFQIDEDYEHYIENKNQCRSESIHKYFQEKTFHDETAGAANRFVVEQLVKEHPQVFSLHYNNDVYTLTNKRLGQTINWKTDWVGVIDKLYLSLFDALCSQVQEDLAVCQIQAEKDWLAAIHLSAPNHWAPADKIGKPFGAVHGVVPGMEKLNQQYLKMLLTVIQKGPFSRFAWGISTDARLNHHPVPPDGMDAMQWHGRAMSDDNGRIYVRVERQTLVGLPGCDAFLFSIRTYFYDISELSMQEQHALVSAVESMSPQSLEYKGLTGKADLLRTRLLII